MSQADEAHVNGREGGGDDGEEEKDKKKKPAKGFKCPECCSIFKHKDHMRRHLHASHKRTNYDLITCPVDGCLKEMFRRDHMQRHISQVHKLDPSEVLPNLNPKRKSSVGRPSKSLTDEPPKRFQCMYEDCETVVSRREHLRRHIKNVHRRDPREVMGEEAYATPSPKKKTSDKTSKRKSLKKSNTDNKGNSEDHSKNKRSRRQAPMQFSDDEDNSDQDLDGHHDYGELLSDDNEFDMETKQEEERDEDESELLCFFCCFSFYPDGFSPMEDLSESLQFNKLISEVIPSSSGFPSALNRLSVCSDCRVLANSAMDKKFIVDELEESVKRLQLETLRTMETLQRRLSEYSMKMKSVEEAISSADVSCLKGFLKRNKMEGKKTENEFVLRLRDGIVTATKKVEKYKSQVEGKMSDLSKSLKVSSSSSGYFLSAQPARKVSERSCTKKLKTEVEENYSAESLDDLDDFDMDDHGRDEYLEPESEDPDFNINGIPNSDEGNSDLDVPSEDSAVQSETEEGEDGKRGRKKHKKSKKSKKKNIYTGDVDITDWSDFKVQLLRKSEKVKDAKPTAEQESRFPDPRKNFLFEYKKETDGFAVGDIAVVLDAQEKSVKCSECDFKAIEGQLPAKETLWHSIQKHIQVKHLSIFQCPICPGTKTLANYKRYRDHLTLHMGDITCDVCERRFASEESLVAHKWYKHMSPEEIDQALQRGEKDPRVAKKKDSGPSPRQQCSICGKHVVNMSLHMEIHTDREPMLCGTCGSTLIGKTSLFHHQKYSCFPPGMEPPRAECDQCPRTFKSKVLLARHVKGTHTQAAMDKAFKCEACGKGFPSLPQLKRHMVAHSDERPYVCRNGCGADYKTGRHRSRHEKLCTGHSTGKAVARKRRWEAEDEGEGEGEEEET